MPGMSEKKYHQEQPPNTRPVIVCTDKRGVFFGYVPEHITDAEMLAPGAIVRIQRARMAVYWSKAVRGVLGLAWSGPSAECRISRPASITVAGIHCVLDVENYGAVERWEAGPWK